MEEKKFLEHTKHGRTDSFEIVDLWPMSHQIWNIGRENFPFEGYIPLCVCDADYHVGLNNLKCVKVESEEMALAAMYAASCCGKPNREWFEKWRERYLMNFEQRCKYLVGKRVDFVTINKVDQLAESEVRSFIRFVSHGNIAEENVIFWVLPEGYHYEISLSFTKEFINRLVVNGYGYQLFCMGYYRNYFLK